MRNRRPILESLEMIESQISEKLTVESIASSAYFSKYHYQRLFREILGESVMEYVTRRRMALAAKALVETDAGILDIALSFGFDSREGFTRSFKAHMGVSPSRYRSLGPYAISKDIAKEKRSMTYSKTTDEIVRELNAYIIKAKDWASSARAKVNPHPSHDLAWNTWAKDTEALADRVKTALERVTSIAQNPDEITNRFAIVDILDSVAFETNVMALNMSLCMVGREPPESAAQSRPYCEAYKELVACCQRASKKTGAFLEDLAKLILQDMRKAVKERIQIAVRAGKAASDGIKTAEYRAFYLKSELEHLVQELSCTPVEKITIALLEDAVLKLSILTMAAKVDVFRWPNAKAMLQGMEDFMDSLSGAAEFCQNALPQGEPPRKNVERYLQENVVFQWNVLFFFFASETEKMGRLSEDGGILNQAQKSAMDVLEGKIGDAIRAALEESGESAYSQTAHRAGEVAADLDALAREIGAYGGALGILADEFRALAEKVQ